MAEDPRIPERNEDILEGILAGRLAARLVDGRLHVRVREPWLDLLNILLWLAIYLFIGSLIAWGLRWLIATLRGGRQAIDDWSIMILTTLSSLKVCYEHLSEGDDPSLVRDFRSRHWAVGLVLIVILIALSFWGQYCLPV